MFVCSLQLGSVIQPAAAVCSRSDKVRLAGECESLLGVTAVSGTGAEHCGVAYTQGATVEVDSSAAVGDKLAEEGFLGVQAGRRGATVGRVVSLQNYSTSVAVCVCVCV